jgi:glycosyltransferase involved in cell wall biosynthesis
VRVAINALFWNQPTTGSGQYVRRLVSQLAESAPDVQQLLIAPRGQSVYRPPAGVTVASGALSARGGVRKLLYEQWALGRTAGHLTADLVHVPYFAPPRWSRLPVVVTIHDVIPLLLRGYRGGPLVRAYSAWVAAAAHRAAAVLTDSHAAARDILQHLRLPAERVHVVHLAADAAYRPVEGEADQELRNISQRLGLPESYILYLGGFDRRKQVPELLQAFARSGLAKELPLVVAGRLPGHDSAFAPDPRPLASALGIARQVIFTGWVEEADKPALYRGARVLAFPSLYEGFGLPVLEALACGTPVVAALGSSLDEVAGPGGLLVDGTDTEALADALARVVQDEQLHATLRAEGLAHAAHFSWEATARQTAQVYREVLRG